MKYCIGIIFQNTIPLGNTSMYFNFAPSQHLALQVIYIYIYINFNNEVYIMQSDLKSTIFVVTGASLIGINLR